MSRSVRPMCTSRKGWRQALEELRERTALVSGALPQRGGSITFRVGTDSSLPASLPGGHSNPLEWKQFYGQTASVADFFCPFREFRLPTSFQALLDRHRSLLNQRTGPRRGTVRTGIAIKCKILPLLSHLSEKLATLRSRCRAQILNAHSRIASLSCPSKPFLPVVPFIEPGPVF